MIFITGITGKTGSGLIEAMIANNYTGSIRALVRTTSNITKLQMSGLNYELCYGDVTDEEFVSKAAEGCDMVCHIAAKGYINVVARAAARTKSVRHCLFVSSTSIFSNYRAASGKLIDAENEMKNLFRNQKGRIITYTIVRPTMIFGDLRDGNISKFVKWLDKYPIFPIVKNGDALLQPVEKRDLGKGIYQLIINSGMTENKEYVISGEKPITLRECLKTICDTLGRKTMFINIPLPIARICVTLIYYVTVKKVDYREKLFRLTEDRSFEHREMTSQFGYNPGPFDYWIRDLVREYKENKKNDNLVNQ